MKRVVIFGPPGSGKSTMLKALKQTGYASIDVENLGDTYKVRRDNFLIEIKKEKDDLTFYGGADLKLDDLPNGTITLLLCPNKYEDYKSMYEGRNKEVPKKAGQNESEVYKWFYNNRGKFDYHIGYFWTEEGTIQTIEGFIPKFLAGNYIKNDSTILDFDFDYKKNKIAVEIELFDKQKVIATFNDVIAFDYNYGVGTIEMVDGLIEQKDSDMLRLLVGEMMADYETDNVEEFPHRVRSFQFLGFDTYSFCEIIADNLVVKKLD